MERIDSNTWRTDNGDEVRARGLSLTVEFGEKTKDEVLRAKDEVMHAVEAVKAENEKLRTENERLRKLLNNSLDCIDYGNCESCYCVFGGCTLRSAMRELGIEARQ